jgi:hypothetical protein
VNKEGSVSRRTPLELSSFDCEQTRDKFKQQLVYYVLEGHGRLIENLKEGTTIYNCDEFCRNISMLLFIIVVPHVNIENKVR